MCLYMLHTPIDWHARLGLPRAVLRTPLLLVQTPDSIYYVPILYCCSRIVLSLSPPRKFPRLVDVRGIPLFTFHLLLRQFRAARRQYILLLLRSPLSHGRGSKDGWAYQISSNPPLPYSFFLSSSLMLVSHCRGSPQDPLWIPPSVCSNSREILRAPAGDPL